MTAHARLSPSSAGRWLRCPGSVNFLERLDEADSGGLPAAEGTILHGIVEDCLRNDADPYSYVGKTLEADGFEVEITEKMADLIQDTLDEIDTIPGKMVIEHRVDLGRWMPGQFGTLDVGFIGRKLITIYDHKFGFNPVSPVKNYQLMLYALGFWDNIAQHETDAEEFELIINQPRVSGGGGRWRVSLDDLLAFGKRAKAGAKATYDPDAPRIPGPAQCAYCEGARSLSCREYSEYNLSMIVRDFDILDEAAELGMPPSLPKPNSLTPERRSVIIEHRPMIDKWLDRLHEQALDDALRGLPTPGLKAVLGRSPARKWKDNEAAEKRLVRLLGEDAYTKKVLSPTQAETELAPSMYASFGPFIDSGQRKPVLVSDQDSRPAIPSVVDLFDDD